MPKVLLEIKLPVKPFSANKMHYATQKKDTKEYREFKNDIGVLLQPLDIQTKPTDKLKFTLIAGFSNKASDLDNAFKPLLDSMQLAMGFDDKQVYQIVAFKDTVPKKEAYLYIKLEIISGSKVGRLIDRIHDRLFTKVTKISKESI
jgi:Holliday junction resolvase RusA-like endonuclease